jgi:hypothetical protein
MRRTDPEGTRRYFRTEDRIFLLNGQWFFAAREGDVGPFESREAAMREGTRHVRERIDLERFQNGQALESGSPQELTLMPKEYELPLNGGDFVRRERYL